MSTQRQRNWLSYWWVLLIPFAAVLIWLLMTQGNTAAGGLERGNVAPDFTLTDLNGNQVSLNDFRGKTVFLNFWATWCPPCRAEMPEMETLYQDYKSRNVVMIGIDIQETGEEVRQFVEENGYNWTFVLDTSGRVTSIYEVTAIPTSYFLDGEGIIRAINVGAMNRQQMEAKLKEAMDK